MRRPRLLVIALDAAELSLVQGLVATGALPEIARVLDEGIFGEIHASGHHLAEVPWTEMLTGCAPATTGYWSPFAYAPDYSIREIAAYDFGEHRPFYAHCLGRKVIVFDVPQARLCREVDGLQLLGWGSHTPQAASTSSPPGLLAEIDRRFGRHPAFPDDWMMVTETRHKAAVLEAALLEGIARRTEIALDLMARIDWDLAFIVCGETHAAGHNFWHLGQMGHPLAGLYTADFGNPLARILQAADRLVGRLRQAAPPGTRVMLFAERGMKANACDLPSFLFLPEILYRHAFGRPAVARGLRDAPPPLDTRWKGDWGLIAWEMQDDGNALRRALRRHARPGLSRRFDRLFGSGLGLTHPYDTPLGYMPPMWYRRHWPRMPAFALPSYADGLIRINLRGRDAQGMVDPADYDGLCQSVARLLDNLRNPRNGEPIVAEIVRTRPTGRAALVGEPHLPDADLVVKWRDRPADVVDSPEHGRIGPLPFRRSGDHTPRGFFAVSGPGLTPRRMPPGRLVDLAPTIIELLGLPPRSEFDGDSRIAALSGAALP